MSEIYTFATRDEAVAFIESDAAANLPDGSHVAEHDGAFTIMDADDNPIAKPDAPKVAAPRDAQPGDLIATTNPLPAAAMRIVAQNIADATGEPVFVRDPTYPSYVVETFMPRAKGERRTKAEKAPAIWRDERGLTEKMAILADLALRPEGVTFREAKAHGATEAKSANMIYMLQQIVKVTNGRYAIIDDVSRKEMSENGRVGWVSAYRIAELTDQSEWQANVDAILKALEAHNQSGKKKGEAALSAPANDAAVNAEAAD